MQSEQALIAIEWREGQPYASAFEDVYFSTDDGLAETQYVFLAQNELVARFQALNNQIFSIAETGFGTGLNFLSTWQLWDELAPAGSQLHFYSVEKYPLDLTDISKALSYWPTLNAYSQQLVTQYQQLSPGQHNLSFADGNVVLHLLIGDIADTLPLLSEQIDAWFLDGFAPAKNPDMWSSALFKKMAALASQQTTFATFTSAGVVRRGLLDAGFSVVKLPGFGKKREMLRGVFAGSRR